MSRIIIIFNFFPACFFFMSTSLTVWKVSHTEFFLVRIFRIWTEYGDLHRKYPYLVRIRENTDHKKPVFGHFLHSVTLQDCILTYLYSHQVLGRNVLGETSFRQLKLGFLQPILYSKSFFSIYSWRTCNTSDVWRYCSKVCVSNSIISVSLIFFNWQKTEIKLENVCLCVIGEVWSVLKLLKGKENNDLQKISNTQCENW